MSVETIDPAWIGVIVNGLLFLVVIFQAEVNRRQLKTMDAQTRAVIDTLDHTRSAFQIAERAYLGVAKIEPQKSGWAEASPGIFHGYMVHFANGGKTPAWSVSAGAQCVYAFSDERINYPGLKSKNESDSEGIFLTSGSTFGLMVALPEKRQNSESGEEPKLFLVGEARYRDFANVVHTLQLVYECELNKDSLVALPLSFADWDKAPYLQESPTES